ncbi:GlxA family transcriptional regulator [Maridesulfovibrio sp.]|uniref:GlxA family transcriptional regulator n=1 Tax=Maridesulfovibrio sp. TaxID=2795000 RepID=UPI002A187837|nr:GlxA family transcriptional regulator [Maridesulfovibrio sp.]
MINISILAVPGCLHSAVYGIEEILCMANNLNGSPAFNYQVLSADSKPVETYAGTRITPAASISDAQQDIIILPPLLGTVDGVAADREITDWLRQQHSAGTLITSVCAGSFLLAETGVLDGREATTHWKLAEQFRTRYPLVNLHIERLIVDGGDYICAGGISAWMDLALHLITRHAGRKISLQCAKIMLMDPHRELQTPYGLGGFQKNHGDTAILDAQEWIEKNYATALYVKEMADAALLGERTFLRRFRAATGHTPTQYLQQVRIEAAQRLLETTNLSVEDVASAVGYGDYSTFRKLFKRIMGATPSAYRQRFGLHAGSQKR